MQSVATTSPTKDSTAAATTGWRKGEEAYFASKTKDLPLRIQWTATKGKAAFARRPITQGEVILTETPLVCMQHIANADLVATCARCLRFIGTLESQVALLAAVDDDSVPPLPALDKDASILSPVVPCPGGCGVEYCGYACQKVHATAGHSLTCPGPPVADQPLGASPWRLFMQQARGAFCLLAASHHTHTQHTTHHTYNFFSSFRSGQGRELCACASITRHNTS